MRGRSSSSSGGGNNTYKMSVGDGARVRPCGDVAVCLRLRATKWRHSSDLTAIPEISCSSRVSLVHSLTRSFLPSSPFFHRQPVNLHHVFLNTGEGGRVEACELDTTVNLHFHSLLLLLLLPPSPFSSPVLTHSFLGVFFYWRVTHWTSWKLQRAEPRSSAEAQRAR